MTQDTKTFFWAFLLSILVMPLFTACTPTIAQRGNMLQEHQIKTVTIGTSTRSDVLHALGSPTTQSTFNSLVWYYIGQKTEKRGILDPEVVEEKIFLVAFNEEGVLEAFQPINRERMNIPYIREKTPTHGNDSSLAKEFLGNLGKFNPPTE